MSSGAVEVFDAATLAAPDRFDAWQEAVNTAFVPLRAAPRSTVPGPRPPSAGWCAARTSERRRPPRSRAAR